MSRHASLVLALMLVGWPVPLAMAAPCTGAKCDVPSVMQEFRLVEAYQDTTERFQARYTHHGDVARVDIRKGVGSHEAMSLIDQRISLMRSIYERHVSPYPGELSHTLVCGESYKPVFGTQRIRDLTVHVVKGFATERLTFGACVDDLIAYKGLVAWYWCPRSQTVVQLELMIPKDEPEAEPHLARYLNAIRCDE